MKSDDMIPDDMIPDDVISEDEAQVPKLPDDVAALLRDARTLRGPAPEVRARLRDRLGGALPPDGGGGSSGAPGAGVALPKVPLWAAAAVFAAGIGVGALLPRARPSGQAQVDPSPIVIASSLAPAPTTGTATAIAPSTQTLPSPPITVDLATLPSAPQHASALPAHTTDLAAERALLDVARTALGRGDGALALGPCEEHEKKFPSGALVEEREAIAIQALVLANRRDEAQTRAERFRKRHPRSILLPAVLAAAAVSP